MNGKDLLGPRKRRKNRPGRAKAAKPVTPAEVRKDVRADPLTRAFEQGPFPAAVVQPFPPATVSLFERLTGRAFDPELFAAWERVRAFTDYQGVELDDRLRSNQWLDDPDPVRSELDPIPATATRSRTRRSIRGPAGESAPSSRSPALPPIDLDAEDLGD